MDGSSRPPQISKMFQKFALTYKAKTFEFADEEAEDADGIKKNDFRVLAETLKKKNLK